MDISTLASKSYDIPNSRRTYLSPETIKRWYYDWKRGGIDALQPKVRIDKGSTQLSPDVQAKLLQLKQDDPSLRIENSIGDNLGQAHPIDRLSNMHRQRQKPHHEETSTIQRSESMVEMVHQDYIDRCALPIQKEEI